VADEGYREESAGQVEPEATYFTATATEQEQAIVKEMVEALRFCKSYEDLQRRAEEEELTFEGEDMWTPEAREARAEKGEPGSTDYVPSKPMISVPLHDQNIQQVVNEARQARLAITVKPKAGLANTKVAGYFKGLVRAIQVESGALAVRLWALERAAKVGRGGYRVTAEFANDGDFDLDLRLERILDYSTVYWDPYGTAADRSTADWNLETELISQAERQRRWPSKPLVEPTDGFEAEEWRDWFPADSEHPEHRQVRIGTFRKVRHRPRRIAYHPQTGTQPLDRLPPEIQKAVLAGASGTRLREVDDRSVMIYVCDGTQILEASPWHGRFIPVIETIGKEYFLRGRRRFKGMVANAMDILRAINVVLSAATEVAATMPRAPYIMLEGQDEGFEPEWDELFVANRSRVHIRSVDLEGKPAPFPQRQQTEPQVQGLLFFLRMLHEMYHAVSGSVAPQIRAVNPYDRSGKAIEALQRQGQAGTSNYLDNLATISMPYEGKVLIDAIPHYYDTPGRILRVMGEDDDDEIAIMIKRPFVRAAEGEPVAVPCPVCRGEGHVRQSAWNPLAPMGVCPACQGTRVATKENAPKEWQGKPVEYVDFSEGVYKVQAALDRDYQTKQDEALGGMQALAAAMPDLVPLYADLWVRAMGFSGSGEIADRLKAQNPQLQGQEEMENIPPALQAKFRALQTQHQQAMQALQEAHKMLETDAIKQSGQKEIQVIRGAVQEKLETLKIQGKMLQMGAEQQHSQALERLRGGIETLQQEMQQKHEVMLTLLKELGAKERERHSAGLHDLAAQRADERLEGSATRATLVDVAREERQADREDQRATDTRAHESAEARAAREAAAQTPKE
jgi:hypothetical protein